VKEDKEKLIRSFSIFYNYSNGVLFVYIAAEIELAR
jgi:hypothetical protein